MAFELHDTYPGGLPAIAASAISGAKAVGLDVGNVQRQVLPIATNNAEPIGVAAASAVNPGDGITVYNTEHIVKVVAAASVGHGADVGVASTNGDFGPVAGASGTAKWRVGVALTAAAAGETFSLYVKPRQLSGLV